MVVETYEDGAIRLKYNVDVQGRRHGLFEQFYRNGQVQVRNRYVENQLKGKHEEFREDGSPSVEGTYLNGLKAGSWKEFSSNGGVLVDATYRADILHGTYETFSEERVRTLRATYKEGVLHGKYESFDPDREREWNGSYKDGSIDGAVTVADHGKSVSKQKWKKGELQKLDGLEPFPRSLADLRKELKAILASSDARAELAISPQAKAEVARLAGLRRLQAYRHLCRLRYSDLELVPEWNELCEAAAEACSLNGGLSHDPPKPSGMSEDRYRGAQRGARNSNLSGSSDLVRSINSYMDDSDPSNIDRLGHRRWCLNPSLRRTGMGAFGSYSAMWAVDSSGSPLKGINEVLYPPAGWVPTDFFGSSHAWSIILLRGNAPSQENFNVTLSRLDEHWVRTGEPMSLELKQVHTDEYGGHSAVSFRPSDLEVREGARYLTEVSFNGGRSVEYRYVVAFCEPIGNGK